MSRWLRYFVGKAAQSMRRTPVVQLVAVSTIAVSLLVLGVVLGLLSNVSAVADRWSDEVRLVAFLAEDRSEAELRAVADVVGAWPEVEGVVVRTRAEALADFRASLGQDATLLDGLDPALVPASIEVALHEAHRNGRAMGAMALRLQGVSELGEVENLEYGQDLLKRVEGVRDLLRVGGFFVTALVGLAVIFIISNTVRLALFSRREELEIMQLVGATDRFIRAPYYLEGAVQGTAGALLAVAGLWLVWSTLLPAGGVLELDLIKVPVRFLPAELLGAMVLGAGLVGVLASHLSTGRFLRGHADTV